MTTRTCTHASCYGCAWTPDPTSKRHVDAQAEGHVKTTGHGTVTTTLPADVCAVHRETS